ncbi:MAG: magnesium transporter [Chloroflexi bacterium]|nr:magnesium transporter [Chloroflexota bacterium]
MVTTTYYLSQLIGKPVLDPQGQPVGRLDELIVRLGEPFPPVTGLALRLGGGRGIGPLATFLPWGQVASVTPAGLILSSTRLDLQPFRRRDGELLLSRDLLDQQVIDLNGRKLVRVNDVQLVAAGREGIDLRLAGIDVGVQGLLRRLDLSGFAGWLSTHTPFSVPDRVIPWEGIDPVDLSDLQLEHLGGEYASVRARTTADQPVVAHGLQLTHEKLAELHPADVAELVAQLSAPDRAAIIESLDAETAAEALGELDPDMRGDVLEDLPTEAAVEILAELPPDEAADALAEVSARRADELLSGLNAADALAVRRLMSYPPDTAGGMMNTDFVALQANLTAQEMIDTLRKLAPPAEEIYYVYVVDQDRKLVGVLSLRDLIVAPPTTKVGEIIRDGEVVHVPVDLPEDEVIHTLDKYNLLAVPVTDEANRLVGVITVDDALAALLPEGRSWFPGVRR